MSLPAIESLESRQLFAGFVLHGHVLRLNGSHQVANVMTVGLAPGGQAIEATISFSTRGGPQLYSQVFPLTDRIQLVSIIGGNGNDLITVDQTNGSFPIRCNMNGGAGNDTIIGGDEPDSMKGGTGNDLLIGGGGNDTLYGNSGNDTLMGGSGNNYLNGGLGHDLLVGVAGNNTLADAYGPDTLYGGTGHNLFIVSVIGQDKTDFDHTRDRVRVVSISSGSSDTSLLNSIFPITSLF